MPPRRRIGKRLIKSLLPIALVVVLAVAGAFSFVIYCVTRPSKKPYVVTPESFSRISGRAIKVTDETEKLFLDLPQVFNVGRYHSWVVDEKAIPDVLTVTAIDEVDNSAMAIRHKEYDVRGVQFHPESILTEYGKEMMKNWLS